MSYYKKENLYSNSGFTLLFASLVSSLLLAISLGIFNIVFRELRLFSSARESLSAFYAADTGTECALFWDIQGRVFATSSNISSVPSSGVSCDNQDIATSWSIGPAGSAPPFAITTFNLNRSGSHCSTVVVSKRENSTTIESRGYNTCDTNNPRRVERGIRVSY